MGAFPFSVGSAPYKVRVLVYVERSVAAKKQREVKTQRRARCVPLDGLESRVSTLERDVSMLKNSMSALSEEMSALKFAVKQVDERTLRGERLMLDMQGEQHRMSRTIDRIAQTLNVPKDDHDPRR